MPPINRKDRTYSISATLAGTYVPVVPKFETPNFPDSRNVFEIPSADENVRSDTGRRTRSASFSVAYDPADPAYAIMSDAYANNTVVYFRVSLPGPTGPVEFSTLPYKVSEFSDPAQEGYVSTSVTLVMH